MRKSVESFLFHYGVKGMRWGVRKDDSSGYRLKSNVMTIDPDINGATKSAGQEVARLMSDRYGFELTSLKTLGPDHPEYDYGTVGFVQSTPGQRGGQIYVRNHNLGKELKGAEDIGWFAAGCGNEKAFLTHESGHALFHAEQKTVSGFLGPKTVGGSSDARSKALKAAVKQLKQDGSSVYDFASKVSGYAKEAGVLEEVEAELFSQYHWGSNPPNFVKVWGSTLHRELGVDGTPFREVV